MLCAAPFVDELLAGVPTVGAADIRAALHLSYGAAAAAVLSVPLLLGLLVEAPLLLLAKRIGRRRMAAASFGVMAAAALAAASAGSAWQLALALSVAGAASGLGLALVETVLMDAAPGARELWMTRWTLGGALGDLAAPALLAVLAWAGFGWRGAFVAAAAATALAALPLVRCMPDDSGDPDDGERPALGAALRRALANKPLLLWCGGALACDLLDEILVVVAVLYLRESRGAEPALAALALAVLPSAATLGLLVAQRLLDRLHPLRWLAASSVLCTLALAGFLALPGLPAAVAMLAVVGFTAASMWPIATAQAYRAMPEDSTVVAAVANLFAPIAVVLPITIAAAGDRWGLTAAVSLLAAQPLALLALACTSRPTPD